MASLAATQERHAVIARLEAALARL